jgi:hypothetical protein
MSVTRQGRQACLHEPVDADGAPSEFLPFTAEEEAYNADYDRDTTAS